MKFAFWIPEELKAEKSDLLALFFIIAAAVALRLHFLSAPIHHDEALSFLEFVSKPFYMGITRYSDPNNHLFHTLLAHLAYASLGHQPWMIRLPALAAGILLIPASYVATRMFYKDKNAALFAAALVGASSSLVRYSVLSRGYSLLCLIFLITLSLAVFLRRNPDLRVWSLFSVFSALGFYTIPIMLYPYGVLMVWLALTFTFEKTERARAVLFRRLLSSALLTAALVFTLYLPVFVVTGFRAVVANGMVRPRPWSQILGLQRETFYATWLDWNKDMPLWISGMLLVAFFLAILFHRRISHHRIPLAAPALLWLIPLLLLQRVTPPPRVWLFLLPVYLMMAAAGLALCVERALARFTKPRAVAALAQPAGFALAVALSLLLSWNVLQTDHIYNPIGAIWEGEEITCFLKDYLRSGDRVMAPGENSEMKYYFILQDVPLVYFTDAPGGNDRIIYVAGEGRGRLDETLDAQGVSIEQVMGRLLPGYSPPRQLKRYRYSTVYELRRIK